MAKYILRNILLLVAISLQLNLSAQNKATGLQTDLINDAGTLYQNGYRSDKTMAELNDSEFSQYQYAAIRSSRPTFSWIVPQCEGEHNVIQRSYQIAVDDNPADAAAHTGKVWNSGRQKSTQSIAVPYLGVDLQANKTYYWSVKVATNHSQGEWSKIESFRTAQEVKPYAVSYRPQIREKEHPVLIRKTYPQTTFIDFGRASFCSLELTLESPRDNDTIYVAIGEDCKDGRVNSHPHGTVRYYRYALPLRKGRHTYPIIPAHDKRNTGPQAVLMPEYIGEVAPMRYCQIDGYTGTLSQQDIVRHTAIYPFDYAAAHFHSDNEILNSVWELCKYTIKATSALGIYIDGDRERIPYEADALINQLCHYTTDREYAMARRSSEYLLDHPTWPTEWILQALIIAWNDYLYTGDKRSIEANYDILKARTLQSLRRENGLISTTDDKVRSDEFRKMIRFSGKIRDIVDWPRRGEWQHGEDDGYQLTDYNTVVNAFHYRALSILKQMAQLTNRKAEAEQLKAECEKLHNDFNTYFYDSEKGLYRDGIGSNHHSLHANHFSLALGLVPESRTEQILKYICSRGMACSVYAAQFLMDAIYESGGDDYGLHMLTKQDERSWYNMVRKNSTITYEAWDNKFKANQDWNHAWGAAPANIIPRYVVGVRPLKAGFAEMTIAPQTSNLSEVQATVPTIRGSVEAKISNTPHNYTLRLTIPANTTAEVSLPDSDKISDSAQLRINGRKTKLRRLPNNRIDCGRLGSGEWLIELDYSSK
ncbi:MAG: alpha-L-rhamnosidase [Rikenellaceae bacterium]|nr:alpha-L-rhamnosidase [Rikenellaceae bacterium]